MPSARLVARFNDPTRFDNALLALEKARFTPDTVSIVTRPDPDHVERSGTDLPDAKETSGAVVAGAVTAGAVGGLLSAATLIGPVMVAGPLVAAMAGAAGGSISASLGHPPTDAQKAEMLDDAVAAGDRLIIIDDVEHRIDDAAMILQTCGSIDQYRFTDLD